MGTYTYILFISAINLLAVCVQSAVCSCNSRYSRLSRPVMFGDIRHAVQKVVPGTKSHAIKKKKSSQIYQVTPDAKRRASGNRLRKD